MDAMKKRHELKVRLARERQIKDREIAADCLHLKAENERLTSTIEAMAAEIENQQMSILELTDDRNWHKSEYEGYQEEYRRLKARLESLTPGGSEFHNSPDNCLRWIDERLDTVVNLIHDRKMERQENERLREALRATWDALDGLYGADRGEVIPIELLPEDRQQLFHKALELVGAALDGR